MKGQRKMCKIFKNDMLRLALMPVIENKHLAILKDGDILYDNSQHLLSLCVCLCHKLYHRIFYTASGLENDSTLGQFHRK